MSKILAQYDECYEDLKKIEEIAAEMISQKIREDDILIMQIAHRIKEKKSVEGKLIRKPEKYHSVRELNDLVGFRVICYFTDHVETIANAMRSIFVIDKSASSDKRKLMDPTVFGYLSLHLIASLPASKDYPEELCRYTFEIQIRTVLQHTWAEIEHNLGYKTEYAIPRSCRREFSRLAGLLEIADEGFFNVRNSLDRYNDLVKNRIAKNDLADIYIDLSTLTAYMKYSDVMKGLQKEIVAMSGAKLLEVSPEAYLEDLHFLGIATLEDLSDTIIIERERILTLASEVLEGGEIDELQSTVGLFYLCRTLLVWGDYNEKELEDYIRRRTNKQDRISSFVARILSLRRRYVIEEKESAEQTEG